MEQIYYEKKKNLISAGHAEKKHANFFFNIYLISYYL